MTLKYSLAALGVYLFALATAAPVDNTTDDTVTPMIIGGETAAQGEFPFVVSVLIAYTFQCGGILLNANTVITAGHCVVGEDPNYLEVLVGSNRYNTDGTFIKANSSKLHDDFHASYSTNDLAIITLKSPVQENNSTIAYAKVATEKYDPPVGTPLTAIGWGRTTIDGSKSWYLNKVTVGSVDHQACVDKYSPKGYAVEDYMFCAGDVDGKGVCYGDSGGPLVDAYGIVQGIVSWGISCAEAEWPAVYTGIGSFADWIDDNKS